MPDNGHTNSHAIVAIPIQKRVQRWELPPPPYAPLAKANPLHISLLRKAQDNHAVLLASLGFSYEVIQANTGLSKGQIANRLRRAGVSAGHYRSGRSAISNLVIQRAGAQAARILNDGLRSLEEHVPSAHAKQP